MALGKKTGGRAKGGLNKANAEAIAAVKATGQTPLEFLVLIQRDESQPLERRIDCAKAAAPYVHQRLVATDITSQGKGLSSIAVTHRLVRPDDKAGD